MMTDDELRKLLAEATPGPWDVELDVKPNKHGCVGINGEGWGDLAYAVVRMEFDDENCVEGIANARLIAAAPTLAAEVLALRAERDAAKELNQRWEKRVNRLLSMGVETLERAHRAEAALSEARAEGMRAAAAIVDGYADGIVNELAQDYIRMAARYALAASGGDGGKG
jgi:hypothetical protein